MNGKNVFSIVEQKENAIYLAKLYEKYHLPAQQLAQDIEELESFRVTVPIVGTFNTGKSSILNALLQFRVLPTAITDSTAVPTEIVYGRNIVTVYRGAERQQVGVQELRNAYFDLQDVSKLRLEFHNPFLERIHSIMLVDMPGLDSGSSVNDGRIYSYLKNSLASIMVFSADEPVVKESVMEFLTQLHILKIPVFIILSKCDKVTKESIEQAKRFLCRSIARQLKILEPEIYCVCVKGEVEIEPIYQILYRLQEQADEILGTVMQKRFSKHRETLQSFLKLRCQGLQLSISELDGQIQALQERAQWMNTMFEKQQAEFAEKSAQCVTQMLKRLSSCLEEAVFPIETMLSAAQSPAFYIDGILRGAVSSCVASELSPTLKGYFRDMIWLLRIQNISHNNVAEELQDAAIRGLNDMTAALTASPWENSSNTPGVLETMLSEICSCEQLIVPILQTLNQPANRKKRPQIAHDAMTSLISTLLATYQASLTKGIERYTCQIQQTVSAMIAETCHTHQAVLQEIHSEKSNESSRVLHTREELQQDLEWILTQFKREERDASDVI